MIKLAFMMAAALALALAAGSAQAGSKLGIGPDRSGAAQAGKKHSHGGGDKAASAPRLKEVTAPIAD